MEDIISIQYYKSVLYWTLFTICLLTSLYYQGGNGCKKLLKRYSILMPLLLAIVLVFYYGLRERSWYFRDMMLYLHLWNVIDPDTYELTFDLRTEWVFTYVIVFCKTAVPDEKFFFFIVALFYVGCNFWACKRLLWENVWLACLFVFFSFQFYPFATNGMRNGMAAALMILAISYFCDRNMIGFIIGILLFLLAFGCHRSILVPMAAVMISFFVIKDVKYAIYIWLICIFLSFFMGDFFLNFYGSLGFDERMTSYSSSMESENTMSRFSRTGFRWDFLLYSAMPVWLAWYVKYKGISNKTFTLLANTYIIANSFWITVIRVSFSNRFAYLSWFMYGLVIAYAVVRLPIWENQDRVAGRVLLAHSAFTLVMFIFG